MNKTFDARDLLEAVGDVVTGFTDQGDTLVLKVRYHGFRRPDVSLVPHSFSSEHKSSNKVPISITHLLHPELQWTHPDSGEITSYQSWSDYIETFVGPEIQQIVETGRRIFVYEAESD